MSGSITTSGLATPLQPQTVGLLVDADEEHTFRRTGRCASEHIHGELASAMGRNIPDRVGRPRTVNHHRNRGLHGK
jgi:hypothetical protein